MLIDHINELKEVLPVSGSFNFTKYKSFLILAESKFLKKEIGSELLATLIAAKGGSDPIKTDALKLAQYAVANKAMSDYVPEGEVHIEGTNIVRIESETSKSLFQYQRNALMETLSTKAYEFLEELLLFAEQNAAADKLNWEGSHEYTRMAKSIVPDASRFSEFVPAVNNSRWIYNRLKNLIALRQQYMVKANCGEAMFNKLLTYNKIPLSQIPDYYREAYQLAATALCYGVWSEARYLFAEHADERGLSKLAKSGSGQIVDSREAVDINQLFGGAKQMENKAIEYTGKFRVYLQTHADQLEEFKSSDKYKDPTIEDKKEPPGGIVGFI